MMQAGRSAGMRTMNEDLANLVRHDLVTKEEAFKVSPDVAALKKLLAGA
jgi:Tfp pilus assembly pilus retraction ATPase PilT